MIAANIMTTDALTVPASGTMLDAFKLASLANAGQIPVVDDKRVVVGVITPRALLKAALAGHAGGGPVADARSGPVLSDFVHNIDSLASRKVTELVERDYTAVSPEASAMEVAALLAGAGECADPVLVVDDRRALLGIISPRDIFKRLWDYAEKKRE